MFDLVITSLASCGVAYYLKLQVSSFEADLADNTEPEAVEAFESSEVLHHNGVDACCLQGLRFPHKGFGGCIGDGHVAADVLSNARDCTATLITRACVCVRVRNRSFCCDVL